MNYSELPIFKGITPEAAAYIDRFDDLTKKYNNNLSDEEIFLRKISLFSDYMDDANMTYEQKLLLTGMKYKLLPGERDTLANYIDTLPISASEKTDIYKKLKGATVYQNGEIYY